MLLFMLYIICYVYVFPPSSFLPHFPLLFLSDVLPPSRPLPTPRSAARRGKRVTRMREDAWVQRRDEARRGKSAGRGCAPCLFILLYFIFRCPLLLLICHFSFFRLPAMAAICLFCDAYAFHAARCAPVAFRLHAFDARESERTCLSVAAQESAEARKEAIDIDMRRAFMAAVLRCAQYARGAMRYAPPRAACSDMILRAEEARAADMMMMARCRCICYLMMMFLFLWYCLLLLCLFMLMPSCPAPSAAATIPAMMLMMLLLLWCLLLPCDVYAFHPFLSFCHARYFDDVYRQRWCLRAWYFISWDMMMHAQLIIIIYYADAFFRYYY